MTFSSVYSFEVYYLNNKYSLLNVRRCTWGLMTFTRQSVQMIGHDLRVYFVIACMLEGGKSIMNNPDMMGARSQGRGLTRDSLSEMFPLMCG